MKFVLVRHTTTDWNLSGRIQGQNDTQLNAEGRREAEVLTELLTTFGISFIVSSDLSRARETAAVVNRTLQVPLRLEPKLRECSFGSIEGLTKEQAIARHGSGLVVDWEDQYRAYDFRPFGGECRDDVLRRHFEVLAALADENSEATPLLVGHGRGLDTLLAGLGYPASLKRGEYRILEYEPS